MWYSVSHYPPSRCTAFSKILKDVTSSFKGESPFSTPYLLLEVGVGWRTALRKHWVTTRRMCNEQCIPENKNLPLTRNRLLKLVSGESARSSHPESGCLFRNRNNGLCRTFGKLLTKGPISPSYEKKLTVTEAREQL